MKRLSLLLVVALLLPVLAGCLSSTAPESIQTPATQQTTHTPPPPADTQQTTAPTETVTPAATEAVIIPDPTTATTAPKPTETTPPVPSVPPETTAPGNAAKRLTPEEARDIALSHAGLTASQVRDLDVELDRDNGTVHYDVDFETKDFDYEYEIHAETGEIIFVEKEPDRD